MKNAEAFLAHNETQYASTSVYYEVKHAPCRDVDGESYFLIPKESTSVTHEPLALGNRERPIRQHTRLCFCPVPEKAGAIRGVGVNDEVRQIIRVEHTRLLG